MDRELSFRATKYRAMEPLDTMAVHRRRRLRSPPLGLPEKRGEYPKGRAQHISRRPRGAGNFLAGTRLAAGRIVSTQFRLRAATVFQPPSRIPGDYDPVAGTVPVVATAAAPAFFFAAASAASANFASTSAASIGWILW